MVKLRDGLRMTSEDSNDYLSSAVQCAQRVAFIGNSGQAMRALFSGGGIDPWIALRQEPYGKPKYQVKRAVHVQSKTEG
jgi:hypothetical protein